MHLKEIVHALIGTYKKVDLRLVIAKSNKKSELAFVKILFSKDQNIHQKNIPFFNSLSYDLEFIQKILDVRYVDSLFDNLQKGILEMNGQSYPISSQEGNRLQENLEIGMLYSEWTSDLYVKKQKLIDEFPPLLIRPPFTTTCSGILSSYEIPNTVKGYKVAVIIHSFLDASSINNDNSRIVILLPIYCMLKEESISDFELIVHKRLLNKISLRIINGNPRTFLLSEIINDNGPNEIIKHHVEDKIIKGSSQISLYFDSLDLQLDKKGILDTSFDKVEPYSTKQDSKKQNQNLMKIQVFISYAKEDFTRVLRLYNDLKKEELNPWLDKKSLLPGQKWEVATPEAIRKSRFFIAVLSSNSVDKVGYVQKELKEALEILEEYPESDVFIIPVRLDDCKISDMRLKKIHR